MKNHFYISYAGNKRNEAQGLYNVLSFDDVTTIVEPYCGTSALSYYISTKKPNLKYVLNDNNKYLKEMFDIILDDSKVKQFEDDFNKVVESFDSLESLEKKKEKYNEIIRKKDSLMGWFIGSKIYCIRPGLFPTESRPYKKCIKLSEFPIFNFYRNNDITFTCQDAIKTYEEYSNKKDCIILLDPPYVSTCNDFYIDSNMNIYEYLYNNDIKKQKAKIYLILENIWIIKLLFEKNNKLLIYDKKYETSQKKTTHIIKYYIDEKPFLYFV